MADEILTLPEAAKLLNLSTKKVYALVRKGALPAFRVGTLWRVRRVDIHRWIAEQQNIGETDD